MEERAEIGRRPGRLARTARICLSPAAISIALGLAGLGVSVWHAHGHPAPAAAEKDRSGSTAPDREPSGLALIARDAVGAAGHRLAAAHAAPAPVPLLVPAFPGRMAARLPGAADPVPARAGRSVAPARAPPSDAS